MRKRNIAGTDVAIVCSILGIVACIILIVDAFLSGGNKTLPIVLLCSCSATLCANAKEKKNRKNK